MEEHIYPVLTGCCNAVKSEKLSDGAGGLSAERQRSLRLRCGGSERGGHASDEGVCGGEA